MLPIATVQYTVIHREQFFFPRLQHEDWTVYIVISGSFRCTLEGKTETLSPGDVYVIPPNVEFDRSVTETLLVHFIRFTLNETPLSVPIPTGKLQYQNKNRAEQTVQMLKQTPKLPPEQKETYLRHCLSDLLLQYNYEQQTPSLQPTPPEDETVRDVLEYLNGHYREPIRLSEIASRFGISPSGLIKKFRKTVGILPQRYLIELRIKKAKQYLVDTSLTVSEISEKTGFETVYYFSKAFKKETGYSPSEYRNSYLI